MQQSLVVIDDFYPDPLAIREQALGLTFTSKLGATYPGKEAWIDDPRWLETRNTLASFVHQDLSGACPKNPPFLQGKFRIAIASDQQTRLDGVHEDVQPWSGVIYLAKPEDCHAQGAIGFYENRETGLREANAEWWIFISLKLGFAELNDEQRKAAYWQYMRDESQWLELERVENKFNRAILLHAKRFHGSIGLFGDKPENGRLTQHFEFFYPQ